MVSLDVRVTDIEKRIKKLEEKIKSDNKYVKELVEIIKGMQKEIAVLESLYNIGLEYDEDIDVEEEL